MKINLKSINLKKFDLKKLLIYIVLFYIIYTPTISSGAIFNYNVTVPILSIALLIIWLLQIKYIKIIAKRDCVFFVTGIILSIIYCFLIYFMKADVFNLKDSRIVQNFLIIFYMMDIYILSKLVNRNSEKENEFFDMVVNLAVLQGIICIIMVIFPSLHQIALDFYYRGDTQQNIFINRSRIYGIFNDYTFSTPVYHGFLASILFNQFLATNNFKKFIKCSIIMISVLLNGRTGIVIFAIACFIYLMYYCFFKRKVALTLKVVGISIVAIASTMIVLKIFVPYTYGFITGFIDDTVSLIFKQEYKSNYAILKEYWFFPNNSDLIFGKGFRVFGSHGIKHGYNMSDIGYVNDIFQGGIIYAGLLYLSIFYFIIKRIKNKEVMVALTLTLLIANLKGEIFHSTIIIFLIMMLCISGPLPDLNNEVIHNKTKKDGKMNNKKISVVMSTYKTDKNMIIEAINSVLNQNYSNFEFIIVCDGDKEEYDYLKKICMDKRIILLLNEKNMGLPYSLNRGIEVATGDYIARMDSDDVSLPNRFKYQVRFLEKNPDISLCSTYAKSFGADKSILKLFFKKDEQLKIQLLYRSVFVHPTVMGKSEVFKKYKYNENFKCAQDYELWSRITNEYDIAIIPKVLLQYRVHNKQASVEKKQMQMNFTKDIIENNSKKISNNIDERILNCLLVLGGLKEFTKENKVQINNDIDYIILKNKKYDSLELKKVLYNRFFELMIKNKMVPKSYSEFKKCIKLYNIEDLLFKIM